jgi:hypothetical protein
MPQSYLLSTRTAVCQKNPRTMAPFLTALVETGKNLVPSCQFYGSFAISSAEKATILKMYCPYTS